MIMVWVMNQTMASTTLISILFIALVAGKLIFLSMPQGYQSDMVRKCFHPSMVPEGLQAPPMALKQLLVLKNTASMKSLTAGLEHNDIHLKQRTGLF